MSVLRRCCLALLLVVSTGPSLAQASPFEIGFVSVVDRPSFGPSVTVFNDSDLTWPPGETISQLWLELFDATNTSLATFSLASLAPAESWTPTFAGPAIDFGVLARVTFLGRVRQQLVSTSLQACLPDDTRDGCIVEYLVPPPDEDLDCDAEPQSCVPERSGGALVQYRAPDPSPVPAPLTPVLVLIGGVAMWLRRSRPRF